MLIVPINVSASTSTPSLTITPIAQTSFQVVIKSIEERNVTNLAVSKISFNASEFITYQNLSTNVTSWTYNTYYGPATIIVLFQHFLRPTAVSFANSTTTMATDTIKLTIKVLNWPFQSAENSLVFLLGIQDELANVAGLKDCQFNAGGGLQWLTLTSGDVALYAQFNDKVVVDGTIGYTSFNLNNDGTISVHVPHFLREMELDPDLSVLITNDRENDKTPSNRHSSGLTRNTYIIIFVPVAFVVLVLAVFFVRYPVRRISLMMQLAKHRNAHVPFETQGSFAGHIIR